MVLSSIDFNKALVDAGVFSCAYGFKEIEGFPRPIPSLMLVGENPDGFEAAFQHFSRWGCEEDGDVVDVHMVLRVNGTYEMWIGPEPERSMYRRVPQADLYRPWMFNVSWIKKFDSTQPFVRELKRYCESAISPVAFGAAKGDPKTKDINSITPINGLPRLVKFELKIIEESECGDDPRFRMSQKRPKHQQSPTRAPLSPQKLRASRRRILDVAFPVSRERIRRSGLLESVRDLPGFSAVTETQVVQAAVNLMLSAELVRGDHHYSQIGRDLAQQIWNHVSGRFEFANGVDTPLEAEPMIVAHQLELDVHDVLMKVGVPTAGRAFVQLQAEFRRMGYVDD